MGSLFPLRREVPTLDTPFGQLRRLRGRDRHEDLAGGRSGGQPGGGVHAVAHRGDLGVRSLPHCTDPGRAAVDAGTHRNPRPRGIAVTRRLEQGARGVDRPSRVAISGEHREEEGNQLVAHEFVD